MEPVLVFAVTRAVDELCHYTFKHMPNSKPNQYKYAGFMARWIAKSKPIYVEGWIDDVTLTADETRAALEVNARFALYVFRSFLFLDDKKLSQEKELVYALKHALAFRDEQGETLAYAAYTWEKIAAMIEEEVDEIIGDIPNIPSDDIVEN